MKKISFETSAGVVYGDVYEQDRILRQNGKKNIVQGIDLYVRLDAENTERLKSLFDYDGIVIRGDWVNLNLSDGYYGSPEYRFTVVE